MVRKKFDQDIKGTIFKNILKSIKIVIFWKIVIPVGIPFFIN